MKLLSAEDLNFENDLAHFGVLGMKWGRRKAKSSSGGSSRKQRRAEKKAARKARYEKALDEWNNMEPEKKKKLIKRNQVIFAADMAIGVAATVAAVYGVNEIYKTQKTIDEVKRTTERIKNFKI